MPANRMSRGCQKRKDLLDLVKLLGEKGRLPKVGFGAADLYELDRLAIVRAKDILESVVYL